MAELSKDDVKHIANLARLRLSKKEEEKYALELSSVLDWIESLKEVDVSDIEALSGGTDLKSIFREDEVLGEEKVEHPEELVNSAPDKKDGFIKVKSVF